MALNDGDKAECKEIAREIVKEVLMQHTEACPYGKDILKGKAMMIGIGVGIAIVGTGTGIGFWAVLERIAQVVK